MIQTRVNSRTGRKSYRVRYEYLGREHTRTFSRLEDARAYERQLREQLRAGDLPPTRDQRAKPLSAFWSELEAQALLERRTLDRYAQVWRLQVEPTFGHVPASKLTATDVRVWVADLLSTGLSRASVAYAVTVLSRCIQLAIEQGIRRDNPTRGRRPRPDIPEPGRGLTTEQVGALVKAGGQINGSMYLLAATSGLRFGELAGLHVGDVDPAMATIAVQRVVIASHGRQIVKPYPKGGTAARRVIALAPLVVAALKPLIDGRPADAPLWPNRVGGPQYYRAASDALRRAQRDAGLPTTGFHALRRTAATLSLQAGMSLRDVQAMLGHSTPFMTMTRYALPDIDSQRASSSRVADSILDSPSSGQNPAIDLESDDPPTEPDP